MVRAYMKELYEFQRLQVMEQSCVHCKTSTMKEAAQPANVEVSYSSSSTFKEAVDLLKLDPHIKRLSSCLSIPVVLDLLVKLFDTLLLDRVDLVVIHLAGSTIIRFKNTNQEPTADSCSVFLAITDVRMRAANVGAQFKEAAFDLVLPVIIAGAFTLAAVVLSRAKFN